MASQQQDTEKVALVAWIDKDQKDWVKTQAEITHRGSMTHWLENVLRMLQKTGKVKLGD